ncbi:MAG: plastocyanin/azurin family copper-binding protein, partial [Longimicrobiales bacterium]
GKMTRRVTKRIALGICLAFLTTNVAACFSERDGVIEVGGEDCPVPLSALGARKAVVAIRAYTFFPDTLRVSAGTTVTWVNCDDVARGDAHTSTSDNGVWNSPLFVEGQTFARPFSAAGNFPYHCQPHPAMRAVIIVQ